MLIPLPIVHGVRTRSSTTGETRAFCGRCVEVTTHGVSRYEQREHLYFVAIGETTVEEVATCASCGQVTAWRGPLTPDADAAWARLSPEVRRAREMDAFLRAHATVPILVRWTPVVIAWTIAIVVFAVLVGVGVASLFHVGLAAVGFVLGLTPVLLFAHREGMRRALEREVAREVEPRVLQLLARNDLRFRALAPRAKQLRLPSIARLLESPVLAHLGASTARGPYR